MSAPACLQWGHAPRDERCVDCDELLVVTSYAAVGRLDLGWLCDDCARKVPGALFDLAEGLDLLHSYVVMQPTAEQAAVAVMNMTEALDALDEMVFSPVLDVLLGDDE